MIAKREYVLSSKANQASESSMAAGLAKPHDDLTSQQQPPPIDNI
jgi:hypothetical protein